MSTQRRSPDDLDTLAAEVGVEVEQELERQGLLDPLRRGMGAVVRLPGRTREKVAQLVDEALDRVYAAPIDVTTAAQAVDRLDELGSEATSTESTRRLVGLIAAAGPVLARLARRSGPIARVARAGTKVVPTGRAITVGTAATLAALRIGLSVRRGVRELQVLASYAMARLRQHGVPVDREEVEQIVVQAYLRPGKAIRVQPGAQHDAGGLGRSWAGRGVRPPKRDQEHRLNRQRVETIERFVIAELPRPPELPTDVA